MPRFERMDMTKRRSSWRLRRLVGLGLVGVLFVTMAGCSATREAAAGWQVLDERSARLADDVVMAVYVSPQSINWGAPGYVLLVNDRAEVSAIRTAGMDVADLVWDERGLFFSDVERDYLLTETGLTTWDTSAPCDVDWQSVTPVVIASIDTILVVSGVICVLDGGIPYP